MVPFTMAINLDVLLQRARQKRDAMLKAAEDEYQATVKSIERVRLLSEDDTMQEPIPSTFKAAVKNVMRGFAGRDYNVFDVSENLTARYPDLTFDSATLSGTVSRLAQEGEATIVEPGAGRRPTTYRGLEIKVAERKPPPDGGGNGTNGGAVV